MKLSACIELLFADETDDFADRIRRAKDAGFDGVEFWRWTDKNLDAVEAALRDAAIPLTGLVAEPMVPLTDPAMHDMFLSGLVASIGVAQRLSAPLLIAQTGDLLPTSRAGQRQALVECLHRAADHLEGSEVVLAIEALNTRVDHPGYYLESTVEGLDIVAEVDRPGVRLLYDIYHAAVMDEEFAPVLDGRLDLVAHVHLADSPGRGEPGSGTLNWRARLAWLERNGYTGFIGLEYRPTGRTRDSLGFRSLVPG